MNPTLEDLRRALQDEASTAPLPAPDAVVAGASARVRADRRRRAGVGAALAAVAVAAGVVATTHQGRDLSQPARSGPFREVRLGGDFPAYGNGDRRLLVVRAPGAKELTGTVDVPTTPGRDLLVLPVCTPADAFDYDQPEVFTATSAGNGPVPLMCMPDTSTVQTPITLGPATGRRTPVDVHMLIGLIETRSGPSFKGATVTLGFYEQLPWADYPKPPRPTGFDADPTQAFPPADAKAVVIGPRTQAEANTPRTVAFTADRAAQFVTVAVRGPGRLRVSVNGVTLTHASPFGPRSDNGWLEFFTYQAFDIGVIAPPGAVGSSGRMRVEVTPEGFAGPDWRVVIGRQSYS